MAPHFHAPGDGISHKPEVGGKADTGPRRTPAAVDPVASVARAFTAEAVDGLALTLAMVGAFRGLTTTDRDRARRALDRWNRTAADRVVAPMLNADSTPAIDGLAGAYRWVPETAQLTGRNPGAPWHPPMLPTAPGTIVPWNGNGPVPMERHGGHWRRFAKRHGWGTGAAGDVREGTSERADQALVARARKGLAEARRLLADGAVPTDAPGRGRPAVWVTALTVLVASGEVDDTEVPDWVLLRKAPDPSVETHWAMALLS